MTDSAAFFTNTISPPDQHGWSFRLQVQDITGSVQTDPRMPMITVVILDELGNEHPSRAGSEMNPLPHTSMRWPALVMATAREYPHVGFNRGGD
jgi:hypothetical protein